MLIATLGSGFIYLFYFGIASVLLNTALGLLWAYLLMDSSRRVWFFAGLFTGLGWFWWIGVSFIYYKMVWAIPLLMLAIGLIYGLIFWALAFAAERVSNILKRYMLYDLSFALKALAILILGQIHPFGFDWYKPELVFVYSCIGIQKWQFAVVLSTIALFLYTKKYYFLLAIFLAFECHIPKSVGSGQKIALVQTKIDVQKKWSREYLPKEIETMLLLIQKAKDHGYKAVVLPESAFPLFLNKNRTLVKRLSKISKEIGIVAGALFLDSNNTPRNSTYIFKDGSLQKVAHKVVLVPFGESNPLPDFLGRWINETFYGGAVDYISSADTTRFEIADKEFTNAICFEATSEKLYENRPQNLMVISNNGWFAPSIEPTLQHLLLIYFSRKYHTDIYHSANMSKSYVILH